MPPSYLTEQGWAKPPRRASVFHFFRASSVVSLCGVWADSESPRAGSTRGERCCRECEKAMIRARNDTTPS